MIELAIAVFLLLLISALASGTEAALFAVPNARIESFVDQKRRGAVSLQAVKSDMVQTITTVVIINNIANIVGSIFVGNMAAKVFTENYGIISGVGIFSSVLTFLVIAFSEIVPKTVGEKQCDKIALFMSPLVLLLTKMFRPLIFILNIVTRPFTKLGGSGIAVTSEAEIKALTELGQRAGIIDQKESELINNVFELNDHEASDIMTPVGKVDYLQADQTLESLRGTLADLTHTRLPILDGSYDQLIGIAHLRTLLQALSDGRGAEPVRNFILPPTFIPSSASGDELLRHFKRTKQHLTIVVDAYGTVLGVLTLEDVLEILVGEIIDETDKEQADIEIIDSDRILALGEADGLDVNAAIEVNLPDMRIGELIIEELGRIPSQGEIFNLYDAEFTVVDGTPRVINSVQIRRLGTELFPEDGDTTGHVAIEPANLSK